LLPDGYADHEALKEVRRTELQSLVSNDPVITFSWHNLQHSLNIKRFLAKA
jgi:hypothetical protein